MSVSYLHICVLSTCHKVKHTVGPRKNEYVKNNERELTYCALSLGSQPLPEASLLPWPTLIAQPHSAVMS